MFVVDPTWNLYGNWITSHLSVITQVFGHRDAINIVLEILKYRISYDKCIRKKLQVFPLLCANNGYGFLGEKWHKHTLTSTKCGATTLQARMMCWSGRPLWMQRSITSPSWYRCSTLGGSVVVAVGDEVCAVSEPLYCDSCTLLHWHSSPRKLTSAVMFSLLAASSYNLQINMKNLV